MVSSFPKQISYRAIAVYLISLAVVSVMYVQYAMKIEYILVGFTLVASFFLLTSKWTKEWTVVPEKRFVRKIFWIAFSLRLIWVILSYFYYTNVTGVPFEYGAADSIGYHEEAKWLADEPWSVAWDYYFGPGSFGVSDVGYPLYLTVLYKIFGPLIMIPRLFKALMSAYMCILVYRICTRTFDESTARMATIMCALMPNLIIYCGYHLKETEMLFLEVAFLERADFLFRTRKWSFVHIFIPFVLAGSLFLFRTVMGAAAVFSFVTAVLLMNTSSMKRGWKRMAIIGWGLLVVLVAGGGTIMTEVEAFWEARDENVSNKRLEQTIRGNLWAKYATGTVMAPMAFVLPLSTMVNVDQQYGQQEKHGGNFIRNFMGFFAVMAIYEALRRKRWRDFSLIGSFVIAYLGVVSLSGFANSERFLLPGLPCLIMTWAFGVSALREKTYKLFTPWCCVVIVMEIAWAYFKLGSRGLF